MHGRRHNQPSMIYKFKSKAAGDVVMLGPDGDALLRLLGREPAGKGIIEVNTMPSALVALERAVQDEAAPPSLDAAENDAGAQAPVSLRRRLWPMIDMLRRSQAAGHPVVWGV